MAESVYTLDEAARRINKACYAGIDYELTPRLLIQHAFEGLLPCAIRLLLAGEMENSDLGQFSLAPKDRMYFEVPREELIQFELVDVISVGEFFVGDKKFSLKTPRNIRIEDCRIRVSDVLEFIEDWKAYSAQRRKALLLAQALKNWPLVTRQAETIKSFCDNQVEVGKRQEQSEAKDTQPPKFDKVRTSVNKVLIAAAWQIENETGCAASLDAAINLVAQWCDDKDEPEYAGKWLNFIKSVDVSRQVIVWMLKSGIEKPSDAQTLGKALENWRNKRNF